MSNSNLTISGRAGGVDSLRLILAFCVVLLHADFLLAQSPLVGWLLVNGLFRVAVPCFFVISGFFLSFDLSSKRVSAWGMRTFKTFAVWTVLYSPLIFFKIFNSHKAGAYNVAAEIIEVLIVGYHHLWYLPASIIGALMLRAVAGWNLSGQFIVVAALYISGLIIQIMGAVGSSGEIGAWTYRNGIFTAFPLMWIGHYLHTDPRLLEYWRRGVLIGVPLLLLEAFTYFNLGSHLSHIDNFISLSILAPSILALALRLNKFSISPNDAATAAGIYFLHSGILSVLRKSTISTSILLGPVAFLISYVAAKILVGSMQRFPALKHLM